MTHHYFSAEELAAIMSMHAKHPLRDIARHSNRYVRTVSREISRHMINAKKWLRRQSCRFSGPLISAASTPHFKAASGLPTVQVSVLLAAQVLVNTQNRLQTEACVSP